METLAMSRIQNQPDTPASSLGIALGQWAAEKKATELMLYDMKGHCSYTDYILIGSGTSERHVVAIAEYLREQSKKNGHKTLGVEGLSQGHWVLLDFSDVIAHIFYEPVRSYYELERLWAKIPQIDIPGVSVAPSHIDTQATELNDDDDGDDDDFSDN
jgi:ribosome-associated protein